MEYEFHQSEHHTHSAGMAVASLILGIAGVVLGCCIYPGFIFGSLAVILSLLSKGSEKKTTGFATAGLVLGIIGIAIGFCMFAFLVFADLVSLYFNFNSGHGYPYRVY